MICLTIGSLVDEGARRLKSSDVDEAAAVSKRLAEHVFLIDAGMFYLEKERKIDSSEFNRFFSLVNRRIGGEPLEYIIGSTTFMDYDLLIDKRALVPRPETELLVEKVLRTAKPLNKNSLRILDIGTGSGNIAVSLAGYLPESLVWAVDKSKGALSLAEENARKNNMRERIKFLESDLFSAFSDERFDIIVSNPPYVSEAEYSGLERTVKNEPGMALLAGEKGTEIIEKVIFEARKFLAKNGVLIAEIGWTQGEAVKGFFERCGYSNIEVSRDYGDRERVVSGCKK